MKLIHYNLENQIDFDINSIWTLVCESPSQFTLLTQDMYNQTRSKQGNWILLNDSKELDIGKYTIYLADYHSISLNDKKAAAILQDNLKKLAYDDNHIVATNEILTSLNKYFVELTQDVDCPTVIRDADTATLFKIVAVAFLEEYDNLFEKLVDYATLLYRLTNIKIMVCINLRSYFTDEQMRKFFDCCKQCDINLLCIENYYKGKIDNEKTLCCDMDLCEFYLN